MTKIFRVFFYILAQVNKLIIVAAENYKIEFTHEEKINICWNNLLNIATKTIVVELLKLLTDSLIVTTIFLCNQLILYIRFLVLFNHLDKKIIIKLSDLLLDEDARSILEIQIGRKLKYVESLSEKRVIVLRLFVDSLWGTRIVPCFQNKFLPSRKETERS